MLYKKNIRTYNISIQPLEVCPIVPCQTNLVKLIYDIFRTNYMYVKPLAFLQQFLVRLKKPIKKEEAILQQIIYYIRTAS